MNKDLLRKLDDEREYFCRKCPIRGIQVLQDKDIFYDVSFDDDVECECPKCGEVFREKLWDINYDVNENFDIPMSCDVCKVYQFVEHLKNEL